ncbi:putative cucumisin [Tanacetum coccineum]
MLQFIDPIAIGAFHAMKNNILTSNSAGNDGPFPGSITSLSPWLLSVAANSIDRKFLTQIVLGNKMTYQGRSINTFDGAVHPIVYGASVPNKKIGFSSNSSRFCLPDTLDPTLVKHKIVVCEDFDGPTNALLSGASGVMIENVFGFDDVAFSWQSKAVSPMLQVSVQRWQLPGRWPITGRHAYAVTGWFPNPPIQNLSALKRMVEKLYLMRRSLEVLRKFHWMILGGRFNQLSHVSSPLLSKPGEY